MISQKSGAFRPGLWLALALLVMLLTGCLRSEKQLIHGSLHGPFANVKEGFLKACKGESCSFLWTNRGPGDLQRGDFLPQRESIQTAAFLELSSPQNLVAQFISRGESKSYYQYALLRKTVTGYRLYDLNVGLMNPEYVAYMVKTGKLTVTEPLSPLIPIDTRTYTVTSREALLAFFEDIAKLDDAALTAFAEHQEISMITRQEAHEAQVRSERVGARIELDNGRAPVQPSAASPPLHKCPSMPDGVICEEIETPSLDIMPRLAPSEVLYFGKADCGQCRSAETAIAQWSMQLPASISLQRVHVDWKKPMPTYYQVSRVPAFVINRRFKIEITSATPANLQQVLSVAASLAVGSRTLQH